MQICGILNTNTNASALRVLSTLDGSKWHNIGYRNQQWTVGGGGGGMKMIGGTDGGGDIVTIRRGGGGMVT